MLRQPRTRAGKIIRGAISVGGVALATAFPIAGGVITRSAAAFSAGVQEDRKNLQRTDAAIQKAQQPAGRRAFDLATTFNRVLLFVRENLILILLIVGAIIVVPMLLKGRRASTRRSKKKNKSLTSVERQPATNKTSAFRRKLKGRVYTSRSEWAAAMLKLRKK